MAFELAGFKPPGLVAAADLSTKQFYFVKKNATDKQVALCDTDGEIPFGVLQNKPNAVGAAAELVTFGITKVIAGETIVAGDLIGTDNAGKARLVEKTNTGADIGDYWCGQAITGGASGELITIQFGYPNGRVESA